MDKKLQEELCNQRKRHNEELSKMKSSFDLQLNKLQLHTAPQEQDQPPPK